MDMDAAGPLMISMFFALMTLVTVSGLVWAAMQDGRPRLGARSGV